MDARTLTRACWYVRSCGYTATPHNCPQNVQASLQRPLGLLSGTCYLTLASGSSLAPA